MINVLYDVKNRRQFREWLFKNHDKENECWVILTDRKLSENNGNFSYLDVVEEALCFGWIDSTLKKVPNVGLIQRVSPRKKGSQWSELNKERCRMLEKKGLMTPAGRAMLPDLSEKSFVIDSDVLKELKKSEQAWKNFQNFPPLYQRVRIDFIQRTKRNKTLYESRLKNFIEKTEKNIMFGKWNDNGKLLEC